MDQLSLLWYSWGSFLALAVALLAAFGVFFDAWRRQADALIWKMLSFLAIVLIAPSIVIAAVVELQRALANALPVFALLGVGAVLLALFSLIMQIAGVGISAGNVCLNCGKPRDPTWTFCPYCEYDRPAPVIQPSPQVYVPPPPLPPTPVQGVPIVIASPDAPTQVDLPRSLPTQTDLPGGSPGAPPTRILHAVKTPMPLAYLVVRSGVHQGKTFQLGESTSIGRKADQNDIVLDDDAVSRQHARVRFEGGKFVLYDLASANGTFIKDDKTGEWKKIQHRQLTEGMTIKLGETILVFMQVPTDKDK